MASEIKVDTISEKTSANGVTIDGVSIKDSKIATANSIDSDTYVDGSIDAAHMSADSIDSDAYVDGSIDTAHIADNQITLAKMAGGTDGNVISYDASGDPVAIATGSDGQVLTSTGAGSPPAFEAAAAGGKILQVQSYSTVALTSQSASTTYVDISSFLIAITPAATSSKILLLVSIGILSADDQSTALVVERAIAAGATTLLGGTASGDRLSASFRHRSDNTYHAQGASWTYVDSPSTTAEITYQLQWASQGTSYINRTFTDTDAAQYGARTISGITAIEVGA